MLHAELSLVEIRAKALRKPRPARDSDPCRHGAAASCPSIRVARWGQAREVFAVGRSSVA